MQYIPVYIYKLEKLHPNLETENNTETVPKNDNT